MKTGQELHAVRIHLTDVSIGRGNSCSLSKCQLNYSILWWIYTAGTVSTFDELETLLFVLLIRSVSQVINFSSLDFFSNTC